MKFYHYIHMTLLVLSFIPMGLDLWPFVYCIIPPLVVLAIYSVNEIVLSRKADRTQADVQSPERDAMLHAYREI